MSAELSTSTRRPFGVARTWGLLGRSRSSLYAARKRRVEPTPPPCRRGPKTELSDEALTQKIREVLAASPFLGEGHRKVWARLRFAGVRTSKKRVLRLMRQAGLLAPVRALRVLGPRAHEGTILTAKPDQMWGTDLTSVMTLLDGVVSVFATVDHCTAECLGSHAAKSATRFEALEPIRQAVRACFGSYRKGIAEDMTLRHDHGSQYLSDHFQSELRFLGITSSPSFVRAPEGNGCIERFFRTLKEQLLWVRVFSTAEDVRQAVAEWVKTYNQHWLLERHRFRSPAQARADWLALPKAA